MTACVACAGVGSFIRHRWDSHPVKNRPTSPCSQLPTAIGEPKEEGRCSQERCSTCNGYGVIVAEPVTR